MKGYTKDGKTTLLGITTDRAAITSIKATRTIEGYRRFRLVFRPDGFYRLYGWRD